MNYALDDDDPRIEAVAREWCDILCYAPDLKLRSVYLGGKYPSWQGYIGLAKRLLVAADAAVVPIPEEPKQYKHSQTPGKFVCFIR